VNGTVYLSAEKDVAASHLQIAITGEERTRIKYRETKGSGDKKKTVTKYANQKNTFLCWRWNLAEFEEGTCPAGQREYPFTFTFPNQILPSSCFVARNGSRCQISYVLEARLYKQGWFKFDTIARRAISFAGSTPALKPVEPVMVNEFAQVRYCCCINKGSMSLGAAVNKDAFMVGQDLEVLYEAANLSTVDATGILVSLTQRLFFKAKGQSKKFMDLQQQLLPPDKLNTGEKRIALEEDPFNLQVKGSFLPSYKGGLVTIDHTIRVTLQTACCITNPCAVIPVQIYSSRASQEDDGDNEDGEDSDDDGPMEVGATQLPPVWVPCVAVPVNLDSVRVVEKLDPNMPVAVAIPVQVTPSKVGASTCEEEEHIECNPISPEPEK